MLFVKDLLFLDGALATLAPDVDLFGEITQIAAYFTERYGARIAHDIGIDPRATKVDLDGMRASMGISTDVEQLTYRDLQARRELIRSRMEEHRRRRGSTEEHRRRRGSPEERHRKQNRPRRRKR
jgi:ubiquinone biosynthesis protein